MKVTENIDGGIERKILIAMIVDDHVCGRIASIWKPDMFRSKDSNVIAKWCVSHFERYSKAPNKDIELRFLAYANKKGPDSATVELSNKLLSALSGEYKNLKKTINPETMIDLAADHFDRIRLEKTANAILASVQSGETEKARESHLKYSRCELGVGSGIDLFQDKEALRAAFADRQQPILKYPGSMDRFFGNAFRRSGLICFMAGEKGTKSFWLQDIVFRAMLKRIKVCLFSVGDMTLNDLEMRFSARAAKHPFKSNNNRWPHTVRVPRQIRPPKKGVAGAVAEVDFDDVVFAEKLDFKTAWAAYRRVMKEDVKSNNSYLKVSVHPSRSIGVHGIRSILEGWALKDWVPEIVVIDYADILAPPPGIRETRDQVNETWMQLRRLNQTLNCVMVTATQANRDSYGRKTLNRSHLSEDKRKLAHCTDVIGINMVAEEKDIQVTRLNYIGSREGGWSPTTYAYAAGCLPFANPCVKSCFFEASDD